MKPEDKTHKMNVYRGSLVLPIKILARTASEASSIADAKAKQISVLSTTIRPDPSREKQGTVEVKPIREDIEKNPTVVNIFPDPKE